MSSSSTSTVATIADHICLDHGFSPHDHFTFLKRNRGFQLVGSPLTVGEPHQYIFEDRDAFPHTFKTAIQTMQSSVVVTKEQIELLRMRLAERVRIAVGCPPQPACQAQKAQIRYVVYDVVHSGIRVWTMTAQTFVHLIDMDHDESKAVESEMKFIDVSDEPLQMVAEWNTLPRDIKFKPSFSKWSIKDAYVGAMLDIDRFHIDNVIELVRAFGQYFGRENVNLGIVHRFTHLSDAGTRTLIECGPTSAISCIFEQRRSDQDVATYAMMLYRRHRAHDACYTLDIHMLVEPPLETTATIDIEVDETHFVDCSDVQIVERWAIDPTHIRLLPAFASYHMNNSRVLQQNGRSSRTWLQVDLPLIFSSMALEGLITKIIEQKVQRPHRSPICLAVEYSGDYYLLMLFRDDPSKYSPCKLQVVCFSKGHSPPTTTTDTKTSVVVEKPSTPDTDDESYRLNCPVCFELYVDPKIVCYNGCTCCLACIERHKETKQREQTTPKCPTCSTKLLDQFIPNMDKRQAIDKLPAVCSYECGWKGRRTDIHKHRNTECERYDKHFCTRGVECVASKKNCTRTQLQEHQTNECPYRLVSCTHCSIATIPFRELNAHMLGCSRRPIELASTTTSIAEFRKALLIHHGYTADDVCTVCQAGLLHPSARLLDGFNADARARINVRETIGWGRLAFGISFQSATPGWKVIHDQCWSNSSVVVYVI